MYKQDWRDGKARDVKPSSPSPLPPREPALDKQLKDYLLSRNLNSTLALQNGWYATRELDGVPRVVMPATSRSNTWPYYQARAMNDCPIRYRSPAVPRGDALMVVHPSKSASEGVMIVEGPMDALAVAGLGYVGVGLMGNRPSPEVITHIVELIDVYADNRCYIIPDSDAMSEAQTLARSLWERGVQCYVKPLVGFKDLAAMPAEARQRWFTSLTN